VRGLAAQGIEAHPEHAFPADGGDLESEMAAEVQDAAFSAMTSPKIS
jgi:hypothetical protein